MGALGDEHRILHDKVVMREILGIQYQVSVLHEVEVDSRSRSAHDLYAQGVTMTRTEQSSPFVDSHLITSWQHTVGCLVQTGHSLRDVDIALTFLHRLAIECCKEVGLRAIVLWNLIQCLIEYFLGVARLHHDIIEHDGIRLQPDAHIGSLS